MSDSTTFLTYLSSSGWAKYWAHNHLYTLMLRLINLFLYYYLFYFVKEAISLSALTLPLEALFRATSSFYIITCFLTKSSYLVTLSFNCFWIPYAISLNFLVMSCHSLIIIWLLFPSSRSYIKTTIFSPFSYNCWFKKAFILSSSIS